LDWYIYSSSCVAVGDDQMFAVAQTLLGSSNQTLKVWE
jgi:hypothetical protein